MGSPTPMIPAGANSETIFSPAGYCSSSVCTARKRPRSWFQERRSRARNRHLSPSEPCDAAPSPRTVPKLSHPQANPFLGWGLRRQSTFLANVEDAIASPVNIPASISRYQKTIQYASTPLDFIFGIGLYLAPSNMALHPGNIQGYNNEIQIAASDATIGHNPDINEWEPISNKGDKSFEGKIAAPDRTNHKGPPSGRPTRPRRATKTKKQLS